jgi:hypothetical protein
MDIFNEVRYRSIDLLGNGPAGDTVVSVKRLFIRLGNDNGHFMLAESSNADSDERFQLVGYVVGAVTVDEYGIQFKAIVPKGISPALGQAKMVDVRVTRKGVYDG